jgi:hypothetical protein
MKTVYKVYNDGGDLVATVPRAKIQAAVNKAVSQNCDKYNGLGRVCIAQFYGGEYCYQYTLDPVQLHPMVRKIVVSNVMDLLASSVPTNPHK